MAKKPNHPCAGCGKLLWPAPKGQTPKGPRRCQDCRRQAHIDAGHVQHGTSGNWYAPTKLCNQCGQRTERPRDNWCNTCRTGQCPWCTGTYDRQHKGQLYCGRICQGKAYSASAKAHIRTVHRYPPSRYQPVTSPKRCDCGAWHRRLGQRCAMCAWVHRCAGTRPDHLGRAKRYGVEYVRIVPGHIYQRDGWVCQLCDQPVTKGLRWPHPASPSLDHIVHMHRGGGHVPSNVQLAHLRCNLRKSRYWTNAEARRRLALAA